MSKLRLFYVPVPDPETAMRLARGAVEARLAACANLLGEMTSVYEWNGQLECGPERVLLLKTTAERAEELAGWLEREHPYECPCILRWEVEANPDFAKWVLAGTTSG